MKQQTVRRTLIALAAVSLAASSGIAAERMVLNEHFTASG
jgi:hypothetical protein